MIDRDPARATLQRTAALVEAAARPAPAAPRFDGYALFAVTYAMSWHFGTLPAHALARRGVFIDVLHRDQAVDRERAPQIPRASPILVDYEIACTLDCAELRRVGRRVIIAIDDDLRHAPPWVRTVTGQPGAPVVREFLKALEPTLCAADALVCPSEVLGAWLREYGPSVHVIPLAVPPLAELPRPGARPHEGIRLGWCGTWTHAGDLELLRHPILKLLTRRRDVTFVLAGQCAPPPGPWAIRGSKFTRAPSCSRSIMRGSRRSIWTSS